MYVFLWNLNHGRTINSIKSTIVPHATTDITNNRVTNSGLKCNKV